MSVLFAACQRFAMVRMSDYGPDWKQGHAFRRSTILQKQFIIKNCCYNLKYAQLCLLLFLLRSKGTLCKIIYWVNNFNISIVIMVVQFKRFSPYISSFLVCLSLLRLFFRNIFKVTSSFRYHDLSNSPCLAFNISSYTFVLYLCICEKRFDT